MAAAYSVYFVSLFFKTTLIVVARADFVFGEREIVVLLFDYGVWPCSVIWLHKGNYCCSSYSITKGSMLSMKVADKRNKDDEISSDSILK